MLILADRTADTEHEKKKIFSLKSLTEVYNDIKLRFLTVGVAVTHPLHHDNAYY